MKTYEEMAHSALLKIEEHGVLQAKRKKILLRTVIPAFVLLIAAAVAFGAFYGRQAALPVAKSESSAAISTQQSAPEAELSEKSEASVPVPQKPVIASFPEGGNLTEACYVAPENGTFFYTEPLRLALERYGDEAEYRVIIGIWTDLMDDFSEETISGEAQRLRELGYTTAEFESRVTEEGAADPILSLTASKEALENFPTRPDRGYVLYLYGELLPTDDNMYLEVQQDITAEY